MPLLPSKKKSRVSGFSCFFDGAGQLQCRSTTKPSKIPNGSMRSGCYVNTSTGRWECTAVPKLHGTRAQVRSVHSEPLGQKWAVVNDVPVVAFPTTVGRRMPNFSKQLFYPLGVGARSQGYYELISKRYFAKRRANPTKECCYDEHDGTIQCPSMPNIHGTSTRVLQRFTYPDGTKGVVVTAPGGSVRMPICACCDSCAKGHKCESECPT